MVSPRPDLYVAPLALTLFSLHTLFPSLYSDAAEESKAEEATPADATAEATESKDD